MTELSRSPKAPTPPRSGIDWKQVHAELSGRCFICELQAGTPGFDHDVVWRTGDAIAFLSKYPAQYGHLLVAPTKHLEAVTADFDLESYLRLQQVVYRVAEAVRQEVPTARVYILSLGSAEGNAHVHWHVVPLPPGTPFEEQQFRALDRDDFVEVPPSDLDDLIERLHQRLSRD